MIYFNGCTAGNPMEELLNIFFPLIAIAVIQIETLQVRISPNQNAQLAPAATWDMVATQAKTDEIRVVALKLVPVLFVVSIYL